MKKELTKEEQELVDERGGAEGILRTALEMAEKEENYEACAQLKTMLDKIAAGEVIPIYTGTPDEGDEKFYEGEFPAN